MTDNMWFVVVVVVVVVVASLLMASWSITSSCVEHLSEAGMPEAKAWETCRCWDAGCL